MGLNCSTGITRQGKLSRFFPGHFPVAKNCYVGRIPQDAGRWWGKNGSQRTWSSQETQPVVVRVTVDSLSPLFSGNLPPARRALGEPSQARRLGRNPFAWPRAPSPPAHLPLREVCLCPSFCPPSPPPNIPAQGRGRPTDTEPSVYGVVCVPHPPHGGHNAPSAPCAPPPHHLSIAHARLQLVTCSGQPPHTKAPGHFKQVPGTPAQLLVPHSPSPAAGLGPRLPQLWLLGHPRPAPAQSWLRCSSLLWVSGIAPAWGPAQVVLSSPPVPPQRARAGAGRRSYIQRKTQSLEEAVMVFCEGGWKALSELPGGADRTRLGTGTMPQGHAEGLQEALSLRWDQDQTPGFWSLLVP